MFEMIVFLGRWDGVPSRLESRHLTPCKEGIRWVWEAKGD